ncbi:T9SS type A sorting domain-containing protein [Chryseobacterium sp. RR2-3-20]|uniref:T9SS type A sorting domain-containing protein n=1 Tax=Chryseobacterium sp. RR2-3-20 TaxID=2787626 RepID=UPI001AE0591B|nr:T9SS type A sorting domain-containing protein [Chryseobacterium sp. RR2-3-20]
MHNRFKISLYNRGNTTMTSAVITYGVGTNTQTYNWTGSLAPSRYALVTLNVPGTMPTGNMTVSVNTVNGSADQRASNNSFTTYFVGSGAVNAEQGTFTFTLQRDNYGSETSWNLSNSSGAVLYNGGPYSNSSPTGPLPSLITQTWTLAPGCYTFTINDSYGDGIYDTGGYYNLKDSQNNLVFQGTSFGTIQKRAVNITVLSTGETKIEKVEIYPNPATDVLNITKVSGNAKFDIYNAVGQLVKTGEIKGNKVVISELVKGAYIITVKDKEISEKLKFIKK